MAFHPTTIKRLPVYRILLAQCVVALILFVTLISFGLEPAYSAVIGALICILPSSYFAVQAFSFVGARASQQIVRAFYRGEAGKFMLTVVLFALSFKFVQPLNISALFLGYIITMAVHWCAPLLMKESQISI